MLRIALYATRGRRVCCLCNYKHDSLFSLWSHYKHFFFAHNLQSLTKATETYKNCLKMSFKWDFSEKTNCSRNEQSLFQQNIPKKMKSIYKHTHTNAHIYYILFAWLLTLRRHSKIIKICAAWTWHIFSLSSVCECASIYLCVCECVVKVIKPQQGRFESESAAIQWVRNCADGCATWANTNSQAQIQKINRFVMQTIYVWTTYIYMYKYLFTRE